jgi:hypothetical protein
MIVFLVALEIGLRLLTDGSHLALASTRRRRGIESDRGIWRTLWAALRRPFSTSLQETAPAEDPADDAPIRARLPDRSDV